MIRAFFEGPAGSGKTHHLIEAAVAAAPEVLVVKEQKLLALTFMNGARHRLNLRFAGVPAFRGRFVCQTFDSFAGLVAHRRRSLLRSMPTAAAEGDISVFDRTCLDAACLLQVPEVAAWVAASYPLIVVDEAQDLDQYRFRLLQALSNACCVLAAADEFQNLSGNTDTAPVVEWLRGAELRVQLSKILRTSQHGLLNVAGALRSGTPVCAQIKKKTEFLPCHVGDGIRLVEPHGKAHTVAWAVADELSRMSKFTVVLTPDGKSALVHQMVGKVQSQVFNRRDQKIGPFALAWERKEEEEATLLLASVDGGDEAMPIRSASHAIAALQNRHSRDICARLERMRNVRGMSEITRNALRAVVEDVIRDVGRLRPREASGLRIMTIQRAKNREFAHVLVLWPHTVTGSPEHQRRLLYNAVTRAKERCSIVVFGRGRTAAAPFS